MLKGIKNILETKNHYILDKSFIKQRKFINKVKSVKNYLASNAYIRQQKANNNFFRSGKYL